MQPIEFESFYLIESSQVFQSNGRVLGRYRGLDANTGRMVVRRYKKAPILEAVLEFRWEPKRGIDELERVFALPAYREFEKPKERFQITASLSVESEKFKHDREPLGFEAALRDGSQRVILEGDKFVFIQSAPYESWDDFSSHALTRLKPTVDQLDVSEFSRVGVRFVNRIDAPRESERGIETDDYITVHFDGPRRDKGVTSEFQMRVVKPTEKEGISYALTVGTAVSPLPDHLGIFLDIDVFTTVSVPVIGEALEGRLDELRGEKNDIFEACIKDRARELFGGIKE